MSTAAITAGEGAPARGRTTPRRNSALPRPRSRSALAALLLLAAPLLLGLGPSDYPFSAHDREGGKGPRCKPRPDRAVIYVIREVDATPGLRFPVWADCRYVGVLKGKSYFCASVDPGWNELIVTGSAGAPELVIRQRLEPGRSYYYGMGHFELHALDEKAATRLIDGDTRNLRPRRDDTSSEARRCPGGRDDSAERLKTLYTEVEHEEPLRRSLDGYRRVLFSLESDVMEGRDAVKPLEKELLDSLAGGMAFDDIFTKWSDPSAKPDLRMKAKIVEYRGVSRWGRAFAGVFAGRARIGIEVSLYDVKTRKRLTRFVVTAKSAPDGTIPHGTTGDVTRSVQFALRDHLTRLKRIRFVP